MSICVLTIAKYDFLLRHCVNNVPEKSLSGAVITAPDSYKFDWQLFLQLLGGVITPPYNLLTKQRWKLEKTGGHGGAPGGQRPRAMRYERRC